MNDDIVFGFVHNVQDQLLQALASVRLVLYVYWLYTLGRLIVPAGSVHGGSGRCAASHVVSH
jgi:hypothetical protein